MTDRDGKDAERLLLHCLTAGLSSPKAIDRTLYELGYPPTTIGKLRPNVSDDPEKSAKAVRESLALSAMALELEDDDYYREPEDPSAYE